MSSALPFENAARVTRIVSVPVDAGTLDVAIDPAYIGLPEAVRDVSALKGLAMVAHPHPLFGGARDNKVVMTLARALSADGFHVLRPNFRGVGASDGVFDDGRGETQDLVNLVKCCANATAPPWWPQDPAMAWPAQRAWVLAGFSFGAFVQSGVHKALSHEKLRLDLVLVGTAVSRFNVAAAPPDTLLIHGETDDVVPLSDLLDWARPQHLPIVVVPGAGHFFHGELPALKKIMNDFLRSRDKSVQ